MKKILLLATILTFGVQICIAQETANTSDVSDTKPSTDLTTTPEINATNTSETNTTAEPDPDSIESINNYFIDDTKNTELKGYAQYSEEEETVEEPAVYLENSGSGHGINFTGPKKIDSKALTKKPEFKPMQKELEAASKFSTQEYDIRPVSTSYSRKYGQFSFGTAYNSALDGGRNVYSTSFFSKYEGKYFALSSGISKSTDNNYDAYSDKVFFAPELKLTKRLSLLDVMKTDVFQINKSNELVLRYTPHMKKYADDVQFEVGAGQTFYEDTYVNSSIRFSTNFKL